MQRLRKLFHDQPFTTHGDNLIPYYKSIQPETAFQNLSHSLQEAISLVRLRQNPLCEILSLWKPSDNPLLNLPMHPYQHLLSKEKMHSLYEDLAVEVVNKIGVDLNEVLQYPHLEAPLQFLCGLGARKAKFILDTLRKRVGRVRYRMQLWVDKLMGKTVYINAIGFIKVASSEEDNDILDTTRIHPENYVLAKKIAKDALDWE